MIVVGVTFFSIAAVRYRKLIFCFGQWLRTLFNGIDQLSCVYCYQIWCACVCVCARLCVYLCLNVLFVAVVDCVAFLWSVKWPNLIRRRRSEKKHTLFNRFVDNMCISFSPHFSNILFVYFSECIIFFLSFSLAGKQEICWKREKNYRSRTTKSHYKTFNNDIVSLCLPCLPMSFYVCVCVYLLQVYTFYIFGFSFGFVRDKMKAVLF